jgi:putative transposase
MRIARLKMRNAGCYYHLVNRVTGTREDRPFDDVEKEMLVRLLKRLSQLYTVEVIAYCVMSNHFHLIVYAPDAAPALPEAVRRLNAHYQPKVPYHVGEPRVAVLAARLPDISHFMHDVQQQFTSWFNRTRPGRRRGSLWAERFKSVILEGREALWTCLKYIELNAVRAGLVRDPAEYRFCSWGVWCGSGRHPFGGAFLRHLRRSLGPRATGRRDNELKTLLRDDMARTLANDKAQQEARNRGMVLPDGKNGTDGRNGSRGVALTLSGATAGVRRTEAAPTSADPTPALVLTRRIRYFSDGVILGSRIFVRELAGELCGAARAAAKRLGRARLAHAPPLYSFRRVQT